MPSLAHDLHVLVRVMGRHAESILGEAVPGLTYPRFLALVCIEDLGHPSQRELAARTGSSEAATSRLVAGLDAAGLVSVDPGAGRVRRICLTDNGQSTLAAAAAALGTSFDTLVESLGLDPAHLQHTIRTITEALQRSPQL
ncbi:MAG: MarR family transcriptional regulator [Actinomycetia bacterium]|nr:MarR family transcriptional regulator [Actinomycetes bacterium]